MFIVDILSNDTILTNSILFFGAKFEGDHDRFYYTNISKICRIQRKIKSKKCDEFIKFLNVTDKPYTVMYKDKKITISIDQKWDHMGMENSAIGLMCLL